MLFGRVGSKECDTLSLYLACPQRYFGTQSISTPSAETLVSPQKQSLLSRHCQDNVLLIPDSLHQFSDARTIMSHGHAGVFYKFIRQDMFGIEFFTNAPCLAYVAKGREVFYDANGTETIVAAGDMLLMPRHHHMVSDFSNESGPLEAWLFFFSDAVINQFLKTTSSRVAQKPTSKIALFSGSACLRAFVQALPDVYATVAAPPPLVNAKLLELLYLLHLSDADQQLSAFLLNQNRDKARRNIKQLMREYALADLTVADYAQLSGRSLSAFHRDFKREFGIAPSKWLRRMRLEHARDMVLNSSALVSEIAHAAGFADTSHFIKAYKAHFFSTPKQHRLALV